MTSPTAEPTTIRVGERLATALATADREALLALLAPALDFRALTPNRNWEATSAVEAVDVMLGTWFGGERRIEGIERIEGDTVADRERVGYRFRATTPDGPRVVEQQAYLRVDDGVIHAMHVVCTGYRPI